MRFVITFFRRLGFFWYTQDERGGKYMRKIILIGLSLFLVGCSGGGMQGGEVVKERYEEHVPDPSVSSPNRVSEEDLTTTEELLDGASGEQSEQSEQSEPSEQSESSEETTSGLLG